MNPKHKQHEKTTPRSTAIKLSLVIKLDTSAKDKMRPGEIALFPSKRGTVARVRMVFLLENSSMAKSVDKHLVFQKGS